MELDTTLSLDVVIAIVVILGAVWRLDSKIETMISGLRDEFKNDFKNLKTDLADFRAELKSDIADSRTELKSELAESRAELKSEIAESRSAHRDDIGELRADMRVLHSNVDDVTQRLSRLEGKLEAGESPVDAKTETDPAT